MLGVVFIEILYSVFLVEITYESSGCDAIVNLFDSGLWVGVWDSDGVLEVHLGNRTSLICKRHCVVNFQFSAFRVYSLTKSVIFSAA